MTSERRNDLGVKLLNGVIVVILGLLINHLVNVAYDGTKIGNENTKQIVQLQTQYISISADLQEIKLLLKRGIN